MYGFELAFHSGPLGRKSKPSHVNPGAPNPVVFHRNCASCALERMERARVWTGASTMIPSAATDLRRPQALCVPRRSRPRPDENPHRSDQSDEDGLRAFHQIQYRGRSERHPLQGQHHRTRS